MRLSPYQIFDPSILGVGEVVPEVFGKQHANWKKKLYTSFL